MLELIGAYSVSPTTANPLRWRFRGLRLRGLVESARKVLKNFRPVSINLRFCIYTYEHDAWGTLLGEGVIYSWSSSREVAHAATRRQVCLRRGTRSG